MTTDHHVEKLATKVMNSLDWTVQAFVDAKISTEAFLQPDAVGVNLERFWMPSGWNPGGRFQTPPAKGTVQPKEARTSLLRQYTTRRLAQMRGSLRSRSGSRANNHLEHCAEGRREVDKTVRTEPQHTFDWQHVESQESIINEAVVRSFMETGKFSESQPREEETDEPNDQSDEEEELCPPIEFSGETRER